jgi:hypothetical protein
LIRAFAENPLTGNFEIDYQFHVDPSSSQRPEEEACICDLRCACGSLMARLTAAGIEIKCRRCGRLTTLVLAEHERIALAARVRPRP